MSQKRVRQQCSACNQITTQVKVTGVKGWKCLCCESASSRSEKELQEIKRKNVKKARFNVAF